MKPPAALARFGRAVGRVLRSGAGHGGPDGHGGHGGHRGEHPDQPVPRQVIRILVAAVVPLLVATIVGLFVLWPDGDTVVDPNDLGSPVDLVDGTVTRSQPVPCQGATLELRTVCRTADVAVSSGPDRGNTASLEITEGPGQPPLEVGDKVILGRTSDAAGTTYYFSDFQRRRPLVWLGLLFAVVVVAVGRVRGLAALAGLVVTFVLVITFVLPALLEGKSPLGVAIVGSAAVMFVILYLAHGISAQTTTALLGTLVSLALTGLLAVVFVDAARIVNLGSEEAAFLQVSASQVNLQGLFLGGVIIGSLGVLNDVTVTQASAVWTLRALDPVAGFATLYRAGMRVGRDHIASTVDTLVLAYAGASLPLLLLFTVASRPLGDIVTGELVAEEIVRTLVGGIGLVAAVPLTTALAALVASRGSPEAAPAD